MDKNILINLFTITNFISIVLLFYSKTRLIAEKIYIKWNIIRYLFCGVCFGFLSALVVDNHFESEQILTNYFVYIYFFENFIYFQIVFWLSKRFHNDLKINHFLLVLTFYWSLFFIFFIVLAFAYCFYFMIILGRH